MPFVEDGGLSVAVIGATGCIGKELGYVLPLHLPIRKLHLFATKRRIGDVVSVEDRSIRIHPFPEE